MSISGDLRVSATVGPYVTNPLLRLSFPPSKVEFGSVPNGRSAYPESSIKLQTLDSRSMCCHSKRPLGVFGEYKLSSNSITHDLESFLHNAINMDFLDRLTLAWKILFPSATTRKNSNAKIAKQRLKMVLFSDRCDVSDEAKHKIVSNIVSVLSDFVVIESQDKVQLIISTDPDIGTIYSVTVPVRRVRPEYQNVDQPGSITNIEYKDTGEISGSVDVKFDFYVPDDKFNDFGF